VKTPRHLFRILQPIHRPITWGDAVVLLGVAVLVYVGVRVAFHAPAVIRGPVISLSPSVLPWYAGLSIGRMAAAYVLSLLFTLVYGSLAARSRSAERVLMPVLDVLQSVPILSFLPVVLLSFSALLPEAISAEFASVTLIFTSQAWNLTFAWYQSLITIPRELQEANQIFRFPPWLRLKTLQLPFAAIGMIWNSMMSWAGGWFFLMAAETFTVGQRDFRLPGLGSYLQAAANQGDARAITWGILVLVVVVIALDQLVWRPLLTWADRFKLETVEGETPPASWVTEVLRNSHLIDRLRQLWEPVVERLDAWLFRRFPSEASTSRTVAGRPLGLYVGGIAGGLALLYGGSRAGHMLVAVPLADWGGMAVGLLATLLRVLVALLIALAWTVPLGVAIGTNPRLAAWLQPVVQIAAAVPATALFPVLILMVAGLPGGLNLAAVLLMLLGTQWYLLFNVIAGTTAIPQDLKYTAALLQLSRWERWRTLTLPALFPHIVTGAITASGGAWNASIVAEYAEFGGRLLTTRGIGAIIAQATAHGDYPLLLAGTISMILVVVGIHRVVWRPLSRLAETRYHLE
jgi:NitT/TauT family transport system permease protein